MKVGWRRANSTETQETIPWLLMAVLLKFRKMKSTLVVMVIWVTFSMVNPLTVMGLMGLAAGFMMAVSLKVRVEVVVGVGTVEVEEEEVVTVVAVVL